MAPEPAPSARGSEGADQVPRAEETPFRALLRKHLGTDPNDVPVLTERFEPWEHIVVQSGLNAYLAGNDRAHQAVGLIGSAAGGSFHVHPTLAQILAPASALSGAFEVGAPDWASVPTGAGRSAPCLQQGVLLITDPSGTLAVYLRQEVFPLRRVCLDVLAPEPESAAGFAAELRRLMSENNPYRRQVLRLTQDENHYFSVRFVPRPTFEGQEVVLPPGILELIEEHTIGIGLQRDRLLAAGRHLKRGLLLWGPPGTGKTHTIKYLISRLSEYTIIEMVGSQLGYIGIAGALARSLAPAVLVLEDVDLIAEDRGMPGQSPRRLLFDLLDMLDGLDEDADVVSVLTTNRPEILETAIAARPGRIDRAIEVPLPDAEGRRRLLDLYGRGLHLQVEDLDEVICRTDGVSPSFIKEMLRQAVLRVAPDDGPVVVTDSELKAVLDVLLDPANPLTRLLLGAKPEAPAMAHGRPGHT